MPAYTSLDYWKPLTSFIHLEMAQLAVSIITEICERIMEEKSLSEIGF
jgi:hypothetical protein